MTEDRVAPPPERWAIRSTLLLSVAACRGRITHTRCAFKVHFPKPAKEGSKLATFVYSFRHDAYLSAAVVAGKLLSPLSKSASVLLILLKRGVINPLLSTFFPVSAHQ